MLSDLIPKAREVEHQGETQKVYALTVRDFAGICQRHRLALNHFVSMAQNAAGGEDRDFDKAFEAIVSSAPTFLAELVAAAVGEPDNVEDALRVPVGWQIKIALASWEMSAIPQDDIKNLLATVVSDAPSVALQNSKTASPSASRH